MSDVVLKVENLSKVYRLGEIGTGTISHDLNRWWARIRGKEDPFATVGSVNDRTQAAQKGDYAKVLSDINFEVKKGEVLGIIGKNGAGKSTLLKLISRITAPTTGHIKAKGRVASLLEVGTGMHPEMTGKENVYLNGTILGMTRREIDAKFDEIMDFAGCAKYADTPVKRYSSGMKVRLGFAVAAFLEPEILIVDEVLAVGDAEFQKKAIGKMQDISSGGGRTVLFVSHNMGSVRALCTRAIVLSNGEKSYSGDVDVAVEKYLTNKKNIGNSDLFLRSDRKGHGHIKFKEIHFLDAKGDNIDKPIIGQQLVIKLQFAVNSKIESKNIVLGIAIVDNHDRFVTVFNNKLTGQIIEINNDNPCITCTIERFPIMPGEYSINLTLFTNNELSDQIECAKSFKVESGDFYNSGFLISSNRKQGVYIDHKW